LKVWRGIENLKTTENVSGFEFITNHCLLLEATHKLGIKVLTGQSAIYFQKECLVETQNENIAEKLILATGSNPKYGDAANLWSRHRKPCPFPIYI
jgi:hypothetical protein